MAFERGLAREDAQLLSMLRPFLQCQTKEQWEQFVNGATSSFSFVRIRRPHSYHCATVELSYLNTHTHTHTRTHTHAHTLALTLQQGC